MIRQFVALATGVGMAAMIVTRAALAQFSDPRIETIDYDPGRVINLRAAPGFATVIDLGPDEHIDNVVVGDSSGWQVTANKRGDHVVVKPLGAASTTNMVIVTGERTFVFQLEPSGGGLAPFVLRFHYPGPPAQAAVPVLAGYRLRGDRALFPVAMYDDGHHTTIAWAKDTPLPAAYALDPTGKERIVNGRFHGANYVIDEVALKIMFRVDKRTAVATRELAKAAP